MNVLETVKRRRSIRNFLAEENGLGTWVEAFDEDEVSKILGLPVHHRPVALIPLGYPSIIPKPTSRLPSNNVVVFR